MYGLLPQSKSSQTSSIVPSPQSVILTTTPCFPSGPCVTVEGGKPAALLPRSPLPSMTIKFSGLMSRCEMPTSWHAWTAEHICPNMREMSRSRLRERSWSPIAADRSEGEGGVSSTRRCAGVSAVIVRERDESSGSGLSKSNEDRPFGLFSAAGDAAREYRSSVPCSCASRSQ